MKICLFGSASDKIDPIYIRKTEELGYALAKRGHSLVFGGGGKGLMGAAARGFKKGGAEICGVIPRFFSDENIETAFSDCTELILCDTMNERKQIMEDLADAFLITPGGIGTFDEFFEVLTNKQLGRHEKPIALYNIEGFFNELEAAMYSATNKRFIKANCRMLYMIFTDPDEMTGYIEHIQLLGLRPSDLKDG